MDVHKTFVVATIITTPTDSLQPHYQKKRSSTFNSDLNRFADWLLGRNCLDVCMESAGKYRITVFNILEKRGIRVVIANPNAFTVCNVALDSVVSDIFEKSATAIMDYLTSDKPFNPGYCVSLLQRSLKKKAELVLESFHGFSLRDTFCAPFLRLPQPLLTFTLNSFPVCYRFSFPETGVQAAS